MKPPAGVFTKSVQTHSFLQAKEPTVVGQVQTNPPWQRLSAGSVASAVSPSSQSWFDSHSAVHSGPVPAAAGAPSRQTWLGHSSAGDATVEI